MILGQYHRQHVSSFYITSTLLPLSTIENWLPPKSHSALLTTRVWKLYYNFTLKVRMYHPCTYSQWNRTTWRFSSRSQLTSSSATCLHNRGLISLIQSFEERIQIYEHVRLDIKLKPLVMIISLTPSMQHEYKVCMVVKCQIKSDFDWPNSWLAWTLHN